MKSERIQMVTNETESCYTCESICMPIKLLIKHTMYDKAVQTPNIVFEAKGADPSKNSLQAKKSNFPKKMKILIRGGGLHIDNYLFLYINSRKNVWCDKNPSPPPTMQRACIVYSSNGLHSYVTLRNIYYN